MSFQGKTLFITGASRGIGKDIALRAAREGANIVIGAKTSEPNPKLPGTIYSAADEIEKAGGKALPIQLDIRDENAVAAAVAKAAAHFGGIDILVNNASAISLTGTLDTQVKRYDLMMSVNTRGTFVCSQACIPFLKKAKNPHILVLSPPINLKPSWFKNHTAYTISKYGMSMCVLGMSEEFRADKIAVNALWPRTVVATAALAMLGEANKPELCRTPAVMSDAAAIIFNKPSDKCTGNFFLAEDVLLENGVTDLSKYSAVQGNTHFLKDLFLD